MEGPPRGERTVVYSEVSRRVVAGVRYALPAVIVVAGILLSALGNDDVAIGAGICLVTAGMLVALANVLMRLGIRSNEDRAREEEARRYYDRYGRWPT